MIERIKSDLIKAWVKPLPGLNAQMQMAPGFRQAWMKMQKMNFPADAKQAAVLCLLYPKAKQLHFVLMKRVTYPGAHSGQISFPGGQIEKEESPLEAALRETFEETGKLISKDDVVGQLTKIYIPPSNFAVFPFLAIINDTPKFIPEKGEVDYLIEVPLKDLLNEENNQVKKMNTKGVEFDAPYFSLNNEVVWGATAIMLNEVKSILINEKINFTLNI